MKRFFSFGKNWQSFVSRYMSEERIALAAQSLCSFLGTDNLNGKTFLDIGCGSGLFSLAAHTLHASRIVSFDADADSVACCERIREKYGRDVDWRVYKGSILDEEFCAGLGVFDIVYSWGVLHHTGDMWRAIHNACRLVREGGLFYIAIYNKADGCAVYPDGRFGSSRFWRAEKWLYTRLPPPVQAGIDYCAMGILIVLYLLTLQNPVRKIAEHTRNFRGMSWRIDIKDWLGGYPYEYARADEVVAFFKKQGFTLENLRCNNGLLNNEYVFKKTGLPHNNVFCGSVCGYWC